MRGVYLLHFSPAYKHAKHYTGYADDIERRVAEHQAGHGARLCEVVVEAGCEITLVRTWPDQDRTFERRLKNQHNAPKLDHFGGPPFGRYGLEVDHAHLT